MSVNFPIEQVKRNKLCFLRNFCYKWSKTANCLKNEFYYTNYFINALKAKPFSI